MEKKKGEVKKEFLVLLDALENHRDLEVVVHVKRSALLPSKFHKHDPSIIEFFILTVGAHIAHHHLKHVLLRKKSLFPTGNIVGNALGKKNAPLVGTSQP